jgi:glutaryl-CoA dehydrogenase
MSTAFADQELIPVANEYWERAEFPARLLKPYAALGVAGGAIKGYGCPGMSPVAEGLVALELARGDGSFSTFNSVHSGLVMTSIGLLGSDEQKQRWLPAMARCDKLGAFALTEPDHGSDVVRLATRRSSRARPRTGLACRLRSGWTTCACPLTIAWRSHGPSPTPAAA